MDMSYLSFQNRSKVLNDYSFIFPLEEISQKGKIMRPNSHDRMTHLGKSCVTMTDLMNKFYEKLSWVMLYVKNSPIQEVHTVKPNLRKTISTKITNVTKNISSNIQF